MPTDSSAEDRFAEDPVRAGRLPPNIAELAKVIIRAAPHSQEELN